MYKKSYSISMNDFRHFILYLCIIMSNWPESHKNINYLIYNAYSHMFMFPTPTNEYFALFTAILSNLPVSNSGCLPLRGNLLNIPLYWKRKPEMHAVYSNRKKITRTWHSNLYIKPIQRCLSRALFVYNDVSSIHSPWKRPFLQAERVFIWGTKTSCKWEKMDVSQTSISQQFIHENLCLYTFAIFALLCKIYQNNRNTSWLVPIDAIWCGRRIFIF